MKFENQYFTGNITFDKTAVVINLVVVPEMYHTKSFEGVVAFLRKFAPKVLRTKCHNPDNLPFREEVKRTEFGHLFEHILITLLCDETVKSGADHAHFTANTAWDWRVSERGTFTITIDAPIDQAVFALAFERTMALSTQLCSHQVN